MAPAPTELEDRTVRVAQLRELLAEKFPAPPAHVSGTVSSGLPQMDKQAGGLRKGSITELAGSIAGGALFFHALLGAAARERHFLALVDGGPCFDLEGYPDAVLARLLWVRCNAAQQAIKAADLLLRDGNLPLIALDLRMLPTRDLRRIPASTWHRFQRLVEKTGTALVVLSRQPVVEAARVRVAAPRSWDLKAMRRLRTALMQEMELRIYERGAAITPAPQLRVLSA
jgi:hypothetical protein